MRYELIPILVFGGCCIPGFDLSETFDDDDDDEDDDSMSRLTGDTGGFDTAQCPGGAYEGPTQVVYGALSCTGAGGAEGAQIIAYLAGWAARGSGVFFWQGTGTPRAVGWSEEHPIDRLFRDPCGFGERLEQNLGELGVGVDGWVPGATTAFTCDHIGPPALVTMAIYVEDADDGSPHCVVTGHDPQGLIDGDYDAVRVGIAPSFDLSLCTVMSVDEK